MWLGENSPEGNLIYIFAAIAVFFMSVTRWPIQLSFSLVNLKILNLISSLELVAKILVIILLFPIFGYSAPIISITIIYGLLFQFIYLWLGKNTLRKVFIAKEN